MPSVFTIEGTDVEDRDECRCSKNHRTYCRVKKSKKHPSGWTFIKNSDPRAARCAR